MDDENKSLIQLLKKFERVIILVITCAMALVLVLVTLDLIWLIVQDIRDSGLLLQIDQLLDIFGLFMLVLIGVELFESVFKSYLQREHTLRVELVIAVAIIAVSRKIIILDWKDYDSGTLFAAAALVISLCAGFFLLRARQLPKENNEST
ncbi:phosphate-starvation-inducible PsiE family protein [Trichlorobacter sp.]|uniref:phosphate-starvation-inducible PsiE family protein n=1 Tax=Trichlorobacter sp. TaxID=2911007 RepID=UPI002A35D6CE|nr:phosphate-starvation-inducible PsiE family protein [Trichlorobacter sp.]MDY0385167.1 phosphate-starvation-inducible PsiE family protein [Trichlorobacter sp.]